MRASPFRPALAALAALACTHALAVDVMGTAYSLLFRSPPIGATPAYNEPVAPRRIEPRQPVYPIYPVQPRPTTATRAAPVVTAGVMRLVNGRTGAEIAQGRYNQDIGGYFFELPMNLALAQPDVCLVLKDPAGRSLPVRDERRGDDGYAFKNPLWEQELNRLGQLQLLRTDAAGAQQKLAEYQKELQGLPTGAAAPGTCTPGSAQPDPPRPPLAMDDSQARPLAGGVCALKWEARLRIGRQPLASLYADAGLEADLATADQAAPVAQALADLQIDLNAEDLNFVKDAALKGKRYLQHAQGLERFRQATQACKAEVAQRARREQAAWEQKLYAARNAPALAQQACEERGRRGDELRLRITSGTRYLGEIDKRIRSLTDQAPAASDSTNVGKLACDEK